MSHNLEIPDGYELHRYEEIGLSLPKPVDWDALPGPEQPIGAQYFLAADYISIGNEAMLIAGMMIHAFPRAQDVFRSTPNSMARKFAESDDPGLSPISRTESARRRPLQKFMRTYTGNARGSQGEGAKTTLICGISNPEIGTVYLATFEAPVAEWEKYSPVARIMIDGIRAIE